MDLQEVGMGGGGKDFLDLTQNRDRWQTIVHAVVYLWVR